MGAIDTLIIFSFIALNLDVLLQNIRVYKMHDSADVSRTGVILRLFAVSVLSFKFYMLDERLLFFGQSLLTVNVLVYLLLVIRYHFRKKHN